MPTLLLLNGPPASGKSTLAARLVERRRLSLNLDIDVVRAQLGDWLGAPHDAGMAARALASAMAETHLAAGHDVVVPQYLGRVEFIEQLEQVAVTAGATFVELVLDLSRSEASEAFETRRQDPQNQVQQQAGQLVDLSDAADPIGERFDRLQHLVDQRPQARRVSAERGKIDATVAALLGELRQLGIDW